MTQLDSAHYQELVQRILSKFERRFADFVSIEPLASCYPFGTRIDVDDIATKVKSLFDLESSTFEGEILTLQNDIDINLESM